MLDCVIPLYIYNRFNTFDLSTVLCTVFNVLVCKLWPIFIERKQRKPQLHLFYSILSSFFEGVSTTVLCFCEFTIAMILLICPLCIVLYLMLWCVYDDHFSLKGRKDPLRCSYFPSLPFWAIKPLDVTTVQQNAAFLLDFFYDFLLFFVTRFLR